MRRNRTQLQVSALEKSVGPFIPPCGISTATHPTRHPPELRHLPSVQVPNGSACTPESGQLQHQRTLAPSANGVNEYRRIFSGVSLSQGIPWGACHTPPRAYFLVRVGKCCIRASPPVPKWHCFILRHWDTWEGLSSRHAGIMEDGYVGDGGG